MNQLARQLLILEPILILYLIYIFWFPDSNRVWSLALALPLLVLRWIAYGRFLSATPLNGFLLIFLTLALFNIFFAPYSRGNTTLTVPFSNTTFSVPWAWVMIGRPLLGMIIYFVLVEHIRHYGVKSSLVLTVLLGAIVAGLALVATQWNAKSIRLAFIIDMLPEARDLSIAPGGFNANEIAGAMAWLAPLTGALALYRWRPRILQAGMIVTFVALMLALFLGQSRLALGGVFVALTGIVILLIRRGYKQWLAFAGLLLLAVAEGVLVFNIGAPPAQAERLETRDEITVNRRLEMWEQAGRIMIDYPLTGVGMNMYRDARVRADYPVTTYERRVLPHAHNEFFQIATDMGIPGLLVFIGIYGAAAYMVWQCWQSGNDAARIVGVATGAALLVHALYGLGDAVALWDRFAFVFWWVLGILGGQYVRLRQDNVSHEASVISN